MAKRKNRANKDVYSDTWDSINNKKREEGFLDASENTLAEEIHEQLEPVREEIAKMREDEVRQRCMDLSAQLLMTEYKSALTHSKVKELRSLFNRRDAKNKRAKMLNLMSLIQQMLGGI